MPSPQEPPLITLSDLAYEEIIKELCEALEPFAACTDQISADEDDEEWAKFRLLIKDYRRATTALSNARQAMETGR